MPGAAAPVSASTTAFVSAEPLAYRVAEVILVAAVIGATAYLSIAITRTAGPIAALWPANAMLLAWLWLRHNRLCHLTILAALTGIFGANVAHDSPYTTSIVLSGVNIVEVILAFTLAKRAKINFTNESHIGDIFLFFLLCCLVATGISGVMAATYLSMLSGLPFLHVATNWWAADALGMALFGSLLLFCYSKFQRFEESDIKTSWVIVYWSIFFILLSIIFFQRSLPLLFLIFPPTIVIAILGGFLSVSIAVVVTTVVAIASTVNGYGPFSIIDDDIAIKTFTMQAFVLTLIISMMLLSGFVFEVRRSRSQAWNERAQADTLRVRAQKADAAKSEFLTSMSHELRTPLNAIGGFAQILAMHSNPNLPNQQEYSNYIVHAAEHLEKMISDILDFARIESQKYKIYLQNVRVYDVFDEVKILTKSIIEKNDCKLLIDNINSNLYIRADETRLIQIICNIVSNAAKYSGRGASIHLSARRGQDVIIFTVRDNGPGVSIDRVDGLFTPFDRCGAEQSAIEGIGVGLAICKKLVELMHGRIGYCAAPDGGALFWFELPELMNGVGETADPGASNLPVSDLRQAPGTTVLYIEDNQANAALFEATFHNMPSIDVVIANCGRNGVKLARHLRPKIIFLDLHLPDISGFSVIQKIRKNPKLRAIPIYALTADATTETQKKVEAAGFNYYITKPFQVNALRQIVLEVAQIDLNNIRKRRAS